MSSVIPGQADPAPVTGPSSSPVASVSASVIAGNAAIALAALPGHSGVLADLRHDAWGHGAPAVAAELLAVGIDALLVDDGLRSDLRRLGGDAADARGSAPLDLLTLYGLPGGAPGAAPAMRLSGTVLGVKRLRAGEGVSYGYSHRAAVDTRVALVSGGYAQGVVRGLGNRVSLAIGGATCPIVGRVAMDVCVVDIGDADLRRGDEAVFFGDPARGEPSLSDWTSATGLSAAEIVTAVGLRAAREAVA
ncbi:alanine racemase C-terminal domain-containing protein [Microbacterium sp. NPDC057407]|uniref:alanine racemase C-terminal domain-containing protein n=1 Tax=Microbacterium sp. NPDC057407 TaxID=3346120 RepID=UPI00367187D7